jgi:kynurenine formamidase
MPSFIDLSAPIASTPENVQPPFLRVQIDFTDHASSADQISQTMGVPRRLMRDDEWGAAEVLHLGTHNSTHVDAPWHYNSQIAGERAQTIDELPLEWFHAPGVKLDMRAKADGDAVTAADCETELARIGHELSPGDIVLIQTGRDRFYDRPDYWTLGPGVTADATHWLYDHGVRVMGIDAWGWDRPLPTQAREAIERDEPGIFWAAHQCDLPYSQIERLFNLSALPDHGFTVSCFPLKVVGASAGPTRAVAILP